MPEEAGPQILAPLWDPALFQMLLSHRSPALLSPREKTSRDVMGPELGRGSQINYTVLLQRCRRMGMCRVGRPASSPGSSQGLQPGQPASGRPDHTVFARALAKLIKPNIGRRRLSAFGTGCGGRPGRGSRTGTPDTVLQRLRPRAVRPPLADR